MPLASKNDVREERAPFGKSEVVGWENSTAPIRKLTDKKFEYVPRDVKTIELKITEIKRDKQKSAITISIIQGWDLMVCVGFFRNV
jgi:hypothetical protein